VVYYQIRLSDHESSFSASEVYEIEFKIQQYVAAIEETSHVKIYIAINFAHLFFKDFHFLSSPFACITSQDKIKAIDAKIGPVTLGKDKTVLFCRRNRRRQEGTVLFERIGKGMISPIVRSRMQKHRDKGRTILERKGEQICSHRVRR